MITDYRKKQIKEEAARILKEHPEIERILTFYYDDWDEDWIKRDTFLVSNKTIDELADLIPDHRYSRTSGRDWLVFARQEEQQEGED